MTNINCIVQLVIQNTSSFTYICEKSINLWSHHDMCIQHPGEEIECTYHEASSTKRVVLRIKMVVIKLVSKSIVLAKIPGYQASIKYLLIVITKA